MLVDEVIVDFHVLAIKMNGLNSIVKSSSLNSFHLVLVYLLLTRIFMQLNSFQYFQT